MKRIISRVGWGLQRSIHWPDWVPGWVTVYRLGCRLTEWADDD